MPDDDLTDDPMRLLARLAPAAQALGLAITDVAGGSVATSWTRG